MLQAIEANPASSNLRISGELSMFESSEVCHIYEFLKSIQSCENASHITKIMQNFWLIHVLWSYINNLSIYM